MAWFQMDGGSWLNLDTVRQIWPASDGDPAQVFFVGDQSVEGLNEGEWNRLNLWLRKDCASAPYGIPYLTGLLPEEKGAQPLEPSTEAVTQP